MSSNKMNVAKRGRIPTIIKTSIEEMLLSEPGEKEKRDRAMQEARFLMGFLKPSREKHIRRIIRRRRRRKVANQKLMYHL
jgi:hypothetical protein